MLLLPTDADLAGVEILGKKVLMEVTLSGCWWRKGCRFTNHTTTSRVHRGWTPQRETIQVAEWQLH